MFADGLSTLSESLRDVRGDYQATKRSMQQGVDALEGQVDEIGEQNIFSDRRNHIISMDHYPIHNNILDKCNSAPCASFNESRCL